MGKALDKLQNDREIDSFNKVIKDVFDFK